MSYSIKIQITDYFIQISGKICLLKAAAGELFMESKVKYGLKLREG